MTDLPDETATVTYYVRGSALYRAGRPPVEPERWSGGEWVRWPDLLGDLLDGDSTLAEVSAEEVAAFAPLALETSG